LAWQILSTLDEIPRSLLMVATESTQEVRRLGFHRFDLAPCH
jgi:hypothetical protein